MNSLFNYELDERKIRLTLKDADLQFSEAAWDDFERNHEVTPARPAMNFRMPQIQLNVNRNILVPVFFVIALAGISGLLFSFVDFKPNKPVQAEKTLQPDASAYSKETAAAPVEKKEARAKEEPAVTANTASNEAPVKQPETKINAPVTTAGTQTAAVAVSNVVSTNNASASSPGTALTQNTRQINTSGPLGRSARKPDSVQAYTPPVASEVNNNSSNSRLRRRKKQISGEQIETIKVPAIITTETSSEDEGELKLQLH